MTAAAAYPIAANGALYDPAQAEEYMSMLFRHVDWQDGQLISMLGIGEKGTDREGIFRDRENIPPAFIGVAHRHLKRWAEWHAAGFIVPAVVRAEAADKGDVKLDKIAALTAIILDIDSGDTTAKVKYVTERLGKPTMTVASGGLTEERKLKSHVYYLFNEPCEDVERVAALRKLLAAKVGGDQSFGRATQVIRVPGSVHAKNGKATLCRILERNDVDYSFDDLAEIIEEMQPMPGIEPAASPLLSVVGGMDFTPRQDTAVAALHRDVHAGGDDLTRWGEFNKTAGFHIREAREGRISLQDAYAGTNGWMLTHMQPPWPQARFDQEFEALLRKDVQANGPIIPRSDVAAVAVAAASQPIEPTRASWPMGTAIKPRPWLFGHWAQRGIVTAVIAPGGIGKSSLMAAMALSMAANKEILGKQIFDGPLRVWNWNLEDSGENLARARIAASMHHGIREEDCGGRLFVDSGPDGAGLCIAVEDRNGFTIIEPLVEALIAALIREKIDVLTVDPFVSSHAVNENDNNRIDAVAKTWARIAQRANCAIMLVHHSVKLHGERVTAESSRGAGALNNAARMTLVLNRMTEDQAEMWGLEPFKAPRFFSVSDDKHNLSAAEAADWYELVSVSLNNATATHPADSIGVVTSWTPPRAMDGVHADSLFQIQKVLAAGDYLFASAGRGAEPNWAGSVVANTLGIDIDEQGGRARIKTILDAWLKSGALKIDMRKNANSKMKKMIAVGHWVGDPEAFASHAPLDFTPKEQN